MSGKMWSFGHLVIWSFSKNKTVSLGYSIIYIYYTIEVLTHFFSYFDQMTK